MDPSSIIKVVGAFAAGVVIALGSALIYVRMSDTARLHTAHIAAPSTPPVAEQAKSVPPAPTVVTPVQNAKLRRSVLQPHHAIVKSTPRRNRPSFATVDVARNHIPATPSAAVITSPPPAKEESPAPPVPEASDNSAPLSSVPVPTSPAPAAVPVREPHVVTLQSGTDLVIRVGETLSTNHNYTGDTFRAALESPIIVDGFIIAEKGSKVLGRVVNAQKAGRVQGVSGLALSLTEISTTDGQRVKIETSTYDKKGTSSALEDTAKIAGGAAIGAIIGAVAGGGKGAGIGAGAGGAAGTGAVLLMRGRPTVVPSETRLTFRLVQPVTITEKLNF